jgi:hypothetical protein
MTWIVLGAAVIGCAALGVWFAPRLSRLIGRDGRVEADLPCAFGFRMAWVAVKTRDTARLISVLEFEQVKPAGWSLGIGTVYNDRVGLGRVFVTPPVDGWSFVVSLGLPLPLGDAYADKATVLIERLSAEFGLANAYVSLPALDFYGWAVARHGELERAFAIGREGAVWNRGAVTVEERLLAPDFFTLAEVGPGGGHRSAVSGTGALDAALASSALFKPFSERDVLELARLWSVDPTRFGQRADLDRGVGYIAVVPAAWRAELMVRAAA